MRTMFTVSILMALGGGAAGGEPLLRVSTAPLEREVAWAPVSFEIRGAPDIGRVRVRAQPGGKELPSQVEKTAGGVVVHWLIPRLAKGARGEWDLEVVPGGQGAREERVAIAEESGALAIRIDGREFTRYVFGEEAVYKPFFHPVIGPTGGAITRHFPMKKGVAGERADHPHHRSLWLTHGEVNGIDFWAEGKNTGRIVHREFQRKEGGPLCARIASTSVWRTPDGEDVLEERRDVRVWALERGEVLMDFDVALEASSGPVTFGSTKEGSFGIRVAGTLKETSGGTVVTARGVKGANAAWGKPAEWIDYYGPVDGNTAGVAILDHPSSFRHPVHWHVRDYGLFAANPFGHRHFYGKERTGDGEHRLEKGESIRLRYRLFFHHGSTEEAGIAAVYEGFARPPALEPVLR